MEQEVLQIIQQYGNDILISEGMQSGKNFFHHGRRSVYQHTLDVVKWSLILTEKLHLNVNESALIRGALLHDYYLYDWHHPSTSHRLHGFTHPRAAYNNALRDFSVTEIEIDIILHHMFPLIPVPPSTREAWIVCIADKISAVLDYTVNQK